MAINIKILICSKKTNSVIFGHIKFNLKKLTTPSSYILSVNLLFLDSKHIYIYLHSLVIFLIFHKHDRHFNVSNYYYE